MKTKKLRLISIFVFLVISVLITGCSSQSGSSKKSDKKYVIAMDMNYAPFEYKENGKWVGIDVELLKAVSKVEHFKYEEKHMNFNGIIPALQANQVDASLAAMFITDERKKTLDFSDGYYESGVGAFANKDNNKINSEKDFLNKTVAVKKGESGAAWAEKNQKKYNFKIQYFDDAPALFQQIANDNADIGLTDYPVVAYRMTVDKNSGIKMVGKFDKANYGFAVKKGNNEELLKKFNDGIKKLKANGEYDKIISKYIKVK
ncbi:transporter substrate-binding domain-containing protein [Sporolactobacillus laevolacticus]|uniref:transporter substrate-binding domain-containing protein n=1 Tax=Sporolactobacillus laevolacticus TaxID=33018 RepID=UPI00041CFA41|nr:transporter substrate-binding domain-containing protein [Sporolactobacillus laevolacticus]